MGTIPSNTPSLLPFDPSYTATQIRDILDRGANVNETINDGRTPLMFAAHHGADLEIIRTLVSAGADVNARDDKGIAARVIGDGAILAERAFWLYTLPISMDVFGCGVRL